MIPDNYVEKVYAGFLGMNAGIRLGAPVEPTLWTYDRIYKTYGEITDYVKEYKNFAADDDANGPVYFLRALYDDAADREPVPQDIANAWLNYAREGVGMFWWGGYGVSTEHTAYLNLKHGIKAPDSGSEKQNGKVLAEQIGGQIFIDTWGLVNPGEVERAARYGRTAASVSHDGEGVHGAAFFCACIAKAFVCDDINEIIAAGLSQIPADSLYSKVVHAVLDFYRQDPEHFRNCYQMLVDGWGYDRYGGVCHIIPNAGVCALAMIYGQGDFARTIEIATMCGWDTDCNAGNVGTVLGVMAGPDGIPMRYRSKMNDGIVLSGISGYLNILDMPTYAKEVALLGYRVCGGQPPAELVNSYKPGEVYFDFNLPGATHNLRLSDPFFAMLEHSREMSKSGSGSLKVLLDRMSRGDRFRLFYKPFYTRDDFSDERYSPVFSPTVYSGQEVSIRVYLDQWTGWETPGVAPYIRTMSDRQEHLQGFIKLVQGEWMDLVFTIPDTAGDLIDEVGLVIEGYSIKKAKTTGYLYVDEFAVKGKAEYTIAIDRQKKEFGTITPFAVDHGAWDVENGKLSLMNCEPSYGYAGNYYAADYRVTTTVTPVSGSSHLLLVRAQGAMRGYMAGLAKDGQAVICKNSGAVTTLANCGFSWDNDKEYRITFEAEGQSLRLYIDGQMILQAEDDSYRYGMYGCGSLSMGRTLFGDFQIQEW